MYQVLSNEPLYVVLIRGIHSAVVAETRCCSQAPQPLQQNVGLYIIRIYLLLTYLLTIHSVGGRMVDYDQVTVAVTLAVVVLL